MQSGRGSFNVVSRRRFLSTRGVERAVRPDYWLHVYRAAMACRFEVTLPPDNPAAVSTAGAALDEIDRLEDRLSIFRDTSELSHINKLAATGPVPVKPDLFSLLEQCRVLYDETEGAFDVTSGPLSRCWGFLKREGRIPEPHELEEARSVVGMQNLVLDSESRTARFNRPGIEINLGSIGKGYALDRIASNMRARGVSAALLSGGSSSVLAMGSGWRAEGWVVGVRHPLRKNARIAELRLWNCGMATSGGGEQYFESEGKRYSHIIDPRTGVPAEGVAGVTVVARSAAVADALATAFYVGGRTLAERYCSSHRDVLAIVVEDVGVKEGGVATRELARPLIIGESSRCKVDIRG